MRLLILSILTLSLYCQDSVNFLEDRPPIQINPNITSIDLAVVHTHRSESYIHVRIGYVDPPIFRTRGHVIDNFTFDKVMNTPEGTFPYEIRIIVIMNNGNRHIIRHAHNTNLNLMDYK